MVSLFGTARRRWVPEVRSGTARVPLTRGGWAVVDLSDLPLLAPYAWAMNPSGYAVTQVRRQPILMHRLIIGGDAEATDHVDRDRLNNRRSNLRGCTRAENNCRRISTRGAQPMKGAAFHRASGKYHATIAKSGRQYSLGYFDTPQEAGAAYDIAARELHGAFALTNEELGDL